MGEIDRKYGTRAAAVTSVSEVTVTLMACLECSLEYFEPAVTGDSAFYALLDEVSLYHVDLRWDQCRALDFIGLAQRVIDVGAGSGSFAAVLRERGIDARTIDFRDGRNAKPDAFADSEARTFTVDLGDPTELAVAAEHLGGTANVATSFHVLEHLQQPVEFARFLRSLVGPNGAVIISVPNRHRFDPDPSQPFDCPPHHVTRWSEANLRLLGRQIGASSCEVLTERLYSPRRIVGGLRQLIRHRLPPRPELDSLVGSPWPPWRVVNALSLLVVYRFDAR